MRSSFSFQSYGSITIVQVYVPGFRLFAVTPAGSLGPCGELPMLVVELWRPETQVTVELVAPATCDWAFAVTLVSGESLAEKVAS